MAREKFFLILGGKKINWSPNTFFFAEIRDPSPKRARGTATNPPGLVNCQVGQALGHRFFPHSKCEKTRKSRAKSPRGNEQFSPPYSRLNIFMCL